MNIKVFTMSNEYPISFALARSTVLSGVFATSSNAPSSYTVTLKNSSDAEIFSETIPVSETVGNRYTFYEVPFVENMARIEVTVDNGSFVDLNYVGADLSSGRLKLRIKIEDLWIFVQDGWVKIEGTWKQLQRGYSKVKGKWKRPK